MTKEELLEIILNGENSLVEFKRDEISPAKLAKEVVAFANFKGGRILLGVEDDGTIQGIQRDKEQLERWVMDTVFGRYIHPRIIPIYEEIQTDKGRVAVITLSEGTAKPYVVRSKDREDYYIRSGSISRQATREQMARLFESGGMLFAEKLPVSGSELESLDQNRLKGFLSLIGDKETPENNSDWQDRLYQLGFFNDPTKENPFSTIAGLVLFGYSPRKILPQAGIRWMAFEGDEKDYEALDDRTLDGPLVPLKIASPAGRFETVNNDLFEFLFGAMQPILSKVTIGFDDSFRRERHWFYPIDAVREAIVNAVAHRDWTRNEEVEVVSYSNRLEILSPGALPNAMTVEKMKGGQRSARNPLIVNVLRDFGFVDARGMGVRNKIIPLLREYNKTEPEFQATEDYLKVIFYKGKNNQ